MVFDFAIGVLTASFRTQLSDWLMLKAFFEGFGDYRNTLFPAWSTMWKCFRSTEG